VYTILAIIFLFGYRTAQPSVEETVRILYVREAGSDNVLTPLPCSISGTSSPSNLTSRSSTNVSSISAVSIVYPNTTTFSVSPASLNTPPVFGANRTEIVNATSTGQHLLPTATGSSQRTTGTANIPSPYSSPVAGLGIRSDVAWSHVFVWAAVTDVLLGIL
jgi:hypothetical protein